MLIKRGMKYRSTAAITVLFVVLTAVFILSLSLGAVKIPALEILKTLFFGEDGQNSVILLSIRLPRVILSGIIGAGLAAVGAVMQDIFKNPLVDSYTLGMSSGAALGAVISIITGINIGISGLSTTGVFAFIGTVLTLLLVYGIAYKKSRMDINSLLLAGVAASYFLSSLISFLMMLNRNKIEHIVFWTMGSLSSASWPKVIFSLIIIIPGILVFLYYSRELNILSLGEESAHQLGVDIYKLKNVLLLICAVMVGCVVSTGGTIGFLGLIAPHIVRIILGPDNKKLIPCTALTGAIILMLSDTVGKVIIRPAEIPVGIMTSVMGGPFFIFLLRKQKANKSR